MKIIVFAGAALFFIAACGVKGDLFDSCLRCICQVEGCDSQIGKCRDDKRSPSCGPYQIKKSYWIDCGKLDGEYETCAKAKACSERCVRAYMKKYGVKCTGGRTPTCQDYARIHNGGPDGCTKTSTLGYWNKVKQCLSGKN